MGDDGLLMTSIKSLHGMILVNNYPPSFVHPVGDKVKVDGPV